jgi:NAD(P)-dependent dehydrogenase (short-subunit alcohol dehydrogenase family)
MNPLSIATFTNIGYTLHSRGHDPIDNDMTGKTVIITGGTGGLGRAAATAIAGLGARTVVVGRSPEKLRAAKREIAGDVVGYEADLGLMAEVRRLVDRLLAGESHLDVLINNVGVLLPNRETTEEGIEKTLATDLAGHFLMTNLLIPRLVQSAPSRVVNVTSGGMYAEKIQPDDLQFERREYKGTAAYAHAKRGQVILTRMWAERLDGTGVSVHAMHPGWARTAGVERSLPMFNSVMRPFLRTPEQGADTIVWLASSPEVTTNSGQLWFDREIVPEHMMERTRESAEDRESVWARLVELTGSDLPTSSGIGL